MSIFGRVADIFQAKTHKLLAALEDPNETLDLSYEKMITGLQDTKRHLADVVAQQTSLERQIAAVAKEIEGAENDARMAMQSDREDLARAALVHKQDALHKREVLEHARDAIVPQVTKLIDYERRLADRIEQFRTQKEVMKASYTAAQAQVKVTETMTGIGTNLGDVGGALRRAGERVDGMRDKADALEGLVTSGVLEDPLDTRSSSQKELANLRATNAVDAEMQRLRNEVRK